MQSYKRSFHNRVIKLNSDQEIAASKMIDFIEGKLNLPYFTLTGGPGTGKTVMINEVLNRTSYYLFNRSAATIAHAAKNVIQDSIDADVECYTVAQWLGMKMNYTSDGKITFVKNKKVIPKLNDSKIAILDEGSMVNDFLHDDIMQIVTNHKIKLIVLGDIFQLPPVNQIHDSKFFDKIDAELNIPMRFLGPIADVSNIYKDSIKDINLGYAGDTYALNTKTNREDKFDTRSGYYFKNDVYELIEQVSSEIKDNNKDINFSRVLAYKNNTIDLLNKNIRRYIYGNNSHQFEIGEIIISKGGFTINNIPIIYNGEILKIKSSIDIMGPYDIPCISLNFNNLKGSGSGMDIPVVRDNVEAKKRYDALANEFKNKALRDPMQWVYYYKFINSFAYFDYGYSTTLYKSQGQTLTNVYVMEGEVMDVKPLTLKQKYQALYVAMTRASKNLYIYNKNY